ncbi:MAG TPA: CheB methylesterase domain-containing protein, partial [Fibrobacteraceae bacterium]|nr:CheB methylesterase domain-containing protein [Fibrobacteraceae bacterium]
QLCSKIKGWMEKFRPSPGSLGASMASAAPRITPRTAPVGSGRIQAVVIGVSTGGPKALSRMLPAFSALVECPILVVQHMPPHFTKSLADSLAKYCRHRVIEGDNEMLVESKTIYIAPGGMHMVVRREGGKVYTALNRQPPENGCRPSVDVLFRSAGPVYGSDLLAVIMTGMGCDGAASLRALKRAGATIVAQDEASSVVWGMPGSAVATGTVDQVAGLDQLPQTLAKIVLGTQTDAIRTKKSSSDSLGDG